MYCTCMVEDQSRLQPLFEDSIGAGLLSRTKQEVIDYMTKKKNFETFCRLYAETNGERSALDQMSHVHRCL